ncbi:hypothetical protein [Aureivirga sp. CE67]|uniref:hypothetical protein n=1 Tax=Aureivirga sp. CE67 TaxID=1788983 RepID=UPI0018C907D3|nr:hypothetical protein [Aureivirga sp. CE67]
MKKTFLSTVLIAICMIITNCSNDDNQNIDSTSPTISIQSPDLNQIFSTDLGSLKGPDIVLLNAYGLDDVKMKTMELTVTNSDGIIVFEKISENTPNTETLLTISELFKTTVAGTYNVVYIATDINGNKSTSNPREFTYEN